jgi:hypothetical protein
MVDNQFAQHGTYRVFWCGDVLYSELVGTFNVEAMHAYLAEVKTLGSAREARWGRLADMRRWDGMTPEAGKLFEEFAQWVRSTQCKVSVQLLVESFQKSMATNFAKRLQTKHLYRCTEAAEAIKILTNYQLQTAAVAEVIAQSNPT